MYLQPAHCPFSALRVFGRSLQHLLVFWQISSTSICLLSCLRLFVFPLDLLHGLFVASPVPPLLTWLSLFSSKAPELVMNVCSRSLLQHQPQVACVSWRTLACRLHTWATLLLPPPVKPCPAVLWDAREFPEDSGMQESGQKAVGNRKSRNFEVRALGSSLASTVYYCV